LSASQLGQLLPSGAGSQLRTSSSMTVAAARRAVGLRFDRSTVGLLAVGGFDAGGAVGGDGAQLHGFGHRFFPSQVSFLFAAETVRASPRCPQEQDTIAGSNFPLRTPVPG
jgi:hypothetical protein